VAGSVCHSGGWHQSSRHWTSLGAWPQTWSFPFSTRMIREAHELEQATTGKKSQQFRKKKSAHLWGRGVGRLRRVIRDSKIGLHTKWAPRKQGNQWRLQRERVGDRQQVTHVAGPPVFGCRIWTKHSEHRAWLQHLDTFIFGG